MDLPRSQLPEDWQAGRSATERWPAAKFPPVYPGLLAALWLALGSIGPVTFAALALGVGLATLFEVYETPFAAELPRANLLRVYR